MDRRIIAGVALLLFLASLALPAFDLKQGDDGYYIGLVMLLFGALSFDPRWLANPLLLIGIVCLVIKYRLTALLALAAASILALLCLTYVGTEVAQNASGVKTTVLAMGPGYYVWLSSILVATAAAICLFFIGRDPAVEPPQPVEETGAREDEQ